MSDPDVDRLLAEVVATSHELGRLADLEPHLVLGTWYGGDGSPQVGHDEIGWSWTATERGQVLWSRRASSEQELSTWMVDEMVRDTAYQHGWTNRTEQEDPRRGWFADWHRFAHLLGPDVGRRADSEMARILAQAPFSDPG